jgi:hypothetical protein
LIAITFVVFDLFKRVKKVQWFTVLVDIIFVANVIDALGGLSGRGDDRKPFTVGIHDASVDQDVSLDDIGALLNVMAPPLNV